LSSPDILVFTALNLHTQMSSILHSTALHWAVLMEHSVNRSEQILVRYQRRVNLNDLSSFKVKYLTVFVFRM